MEARDFVFWLHGFFEIQEADFTTGFALTPSQVRVIREHIGLVLAREQARANNEKAAAKETLREHSQVLRDQIAGLGPQRIC
jgi:hypothetical protein